MNSLKVIVLLSLVGLCLSTLPKSFVGKVDQPQLMTKILSKNRTRAPATPTEKPQVAVKLPTKSTSEKKVPVTTARPKRDVSFAELSSNTNLDSNVYWRNWNGKIPDDAVVGGFTKGECGIYPVYMGQVYTSGHDSALIPVQIFGRSKNVKYSYAGKVVRTKKDVKVLCSDDPSALTWITNKDAERFNIIPNEDCVIGGTEQQQSVSTFFGRTVYEGDTIIGKVLYHNKNIIFPYYGEEETSEEYEIFCYKTAVELRKAEAWRKEKKNKLVLEMKLEETKKQEGKKNY